MKFLKSILVLFMSFIVMSASSQTVSANAYLGTNSTHLLGGDLLVTLKSGVVFGVGGSHATRTIATKSDVDFTVVVPYVVKSYTAERGTVSGLVGYSFKSTSVMFESGVSLRQFVVEGRTGSNESAPKVYNSKTVDPGFLYGMTVTQNFGGRFGVMLGYNNIQSLKFGLSYKITPTKMFKY